MLKRYYITPENSYKFGGNNQVNYTPVVVVAGEDHAHVYVAGRTSRSLDGKVACVGDMRGQIRVTCENIKAALDSVGASFADITKTVTYVTDLDAYFKASDERLRFFKDPLPTSSLIGVSRLAMAELMVEIEVEAIMEPERLRLQQS
jgi:2-iminobutanoate/2-iminopropanoate deaminase